LTREPIGKNALGVHIEILKGLIKFFEGLIARKINFWELVLMSIETNEV
jgi:hypothetical protein